MSKRPREAQPAPLALLLGGGRARAGPATAASKGTAGRSGRLGPGRPAQAAGQVGPAPSAGPAGAGSPGRGRAAGSPPRRPARPRSRVWGVQASCDREAGAAEGVQVGRGHLPAVGEAVDQLRPPRGPRLCDPAGAPGPGVATALPALVHALAEHELEGLGGPGAPRRPWVSMWTDVVGDGRRRAGLGRREQRACRPRWGAPPSRPRRRLPSRGRAGRCSSRCRWPGRWRTVGCGRRHRLRRRGARRPA